MKVVYERTFVLCHKTRACGFRASPLGAFHLVARFSRCSMPTLDAEAIEAEAAGALTSRLAAALALLASSRPTSSTSQPPPRPPTEAAFGEDPPPATSEEGRGSHPTSEDGDDAWEAVRVCVRVSATSASERLSSSCASLRFVLSAEPARSLPDNAAVASFVAGVFAGGGAVAGLPSAAPPRQGSRLVLSTATAGEGVLREYSWRSLPSPLVAEGTGRGSRGGGEGRTEELLRRGEEGTVEELGREKSAVAEEDAWALVGARHSIVQKAERGLLRSFAGTTIAFTWTPIAAAAHLHALQQTATTTAVALGAAAVATPSVHLTPSILSGRVDVLSSHSSALRGLPTAMRNLIEILPQGAIITLQIPPSTAPQSSNAPSPQPLTVHNFMRQTLDMGHLHVTDLMSDVFTPQELTVHGTASGTRLRVPWSVNTAVVLTRTPASVAAAAAPSMGREGSVERPGQYCVYVNFAVQPSSDSRDTVNLLLMKSASWWAEFNLPLLSRGTSSSMGDEGSGGGDHGTGSGQPDAAVNLSFGDGQTFITFQSTPRSSGVADGGTGGDAISGAARDQLAREAEGAMAVAAITGDREGIQGNEEDGENSIPHHVYLVSQVIVHVVHANLLGQRLRPPASGMAQMSGGFRLPTGVFQPPHSGIVTPSGSVLSKLITQALEAALWNAKRSHRYAFISPGERAKVAKCKKVADSVIGILRRGNSVHVQGFRRTVQDRLDETAGMFDWKKKYADMLCLTAFDDKRYKDIGIR